jgi:hypothetical protein
MALNHTETVSYGAKPTSPVGGKEAWHGVYAIGSRELITVTNSSGDPIVYTSKDAAEKAALHVGETVRKEADAPKRELKKLCAELGRLAGTQGIDCSIAGEGADKIRELAKGLEAARTALKGVSDSSPRIQRSREASIEAINRLIGL